MWETKTCLLKDLTQTPCLGDRLVTTRPALEGPPSPWSPCGEAADPSALGCEQPDGSGAPLQTR